MAHRAQTEALCTALIATRFDIVSELGEIGRDLDSGAADAEILVSADLVVRWFREDIEKLHSLVMGLRADTEKNASSGTAFVLVAESATNILNAFHPTRDAFESLRSSADK